MMMVLCGLLFMFFACPIVRSQEKAAPVPKSSFTIDLWEKGLPNSNGMEAQGYDDAKYNFKPCITVYLPKATRPAFQILFYPVITMNKEETHIGSRLNLLGENPTEEMEKSYSNELQVDSSTPRAFIALSDAFLFLLKLICLFFQYNFSAAS
jgi:hypothetical protein